MILIDRDRERDTEFGEKWDEYVLRSSSTTFYHLYGWKRVLARTFGFSPFYILHVGRGGEPDGILPLFLMTDVLGRRYLVSNPFSNFAGVCADSPDVAEELLATGTDLARRLGVQYVELRQLASRLHQDLPTKDSFVTFYLDLADSAEAAWKGLSSRTRGKVRKSERAGVRAFIGRDWLDDFFEVYAEHITFLGTPIFPLNFFRNLFDEFPERTEVIVLRLDGKPISGMFLFKFKEVIAEPWASTLRAYSRIYANAHLYWKAVEYAINSGFKHFDFGRSTVDAGTYQFKLLWGARPVPLYYQYVLNRAREIPHVDAHENKYQLAIEVWKRLPTKLAIRLGPQVVRYLPEL